jgi:hypothetical protein
MKVTMEQAVLTIIEIVAVMAAVSLFWLRKDGDNNGAGSSASK